MCLHTLISAIVGMARAELKKLTLSPVSARMIYAQDVVEDPQP
jgi:hypothetical protein